MCGSSLDPGPRRVNRDTHLGHRLVEASNRFRTAHVRGASEQRWCLRLAHVYSGKWEWLEPAETNSRGAGVHSSSGRAAASAWTRPKEARRSVISSSWVVRPTSDSSDHRGLEARSGRTSRGRWYLESITT